MTEVGETVLFGWLILAVVMHLLWMWQKKTGRAGFVDVAWSLGTSALAIGFCVVGSGLQERRLILGVLMGLWGMRLTVHLWNRLSREKEDGRYESYRKEKGQKAADRFYMIFFQMQAVFALIFASPILVAAYTPEDAELQTLDYIGIGIWVLALLGESIADRQLENFRKNPENRGEVCRVGLWAWSRHPNYFFEWLHWFAYVAIGWHGEWRYLTLFGPIAMLLFLFKFTGIPITEKQALRSRGEKYEKYQREVSVFFPLPPKGS